MGEIHTWWFLVIAIFLAISVGRLGTVLRERFEQRNTEQRKFKTNKLS